MTRPLLSSLSLARTRPLFRSLALALLAALVGCSSGIGISTTVDPLAVFPREATYVWDEAG
ncbi:MAG: hypothetical protein OEP95_12010, partial [Myxococcales bacterium]|nr:hypothetical protein [Myxococcales bacterium]